MVAQGGGGRIIAISSIAGLTGIDAGADYVMSKHAVMGLVRVLARQVGPHSITVNAINPGYVRTVMNRESLDDPARTALLTSQGVAAAARRAGRRRRRGRTSWPPTTPPG